MGVYMAGLGKCNTFIVTRTEPRYMKKNGGKRMIGLGCENL